MLKYGQMTLTVEMVTPAVAQRWLAQNTGNRRLRPAIVDQYSRDMAAHNWERKPVAVCFDDTGTLGNGQHTLSAIAKSGAAQELLVARNVPRAAIAMMDRGLARTINDVATFLDVSIESRRASIARVLRWGPRDQSARSFGELLAAYQDNADVIDFVCGAASTNISGINATTLSVCAKAAYTRDREKIRRFLQIMRTGVVDGEHETAAIRLRDFCRSLRGAGSLKIREEIYNKTMSALSNFLDGKPMSKLYGTTTDLFPIDVPQQP